LVLDFSDALIYGKFECSENSAQKGVDYMPLEEKVCDSPGSIIDSFAIDAY
jgi:hypothetical protein